MFTLEELQSLAGVINTAGRYERVVEVVGVHVPVEQRLAYLNIAKRVQDEILKLEKAEKEKAPKET